MEANLEATALPDQGVTPNGRVFPEVGRPPPRVRGYTLLRELGRGGMGVVYKARHDRLGRVVALKLVRIDSEGDESALARFRAEAEMSALLRHPNVVQVFDVGEGAGYAHLALEFVSGGTLRDRLGGEPQPPRAAAELVELLARAAHAAHQAGVVHRDLKPANILLEPSASLVCERRPGGSRLYGVPKISDFGLAKYLGHDACPGRVGDVLGTPMYMSPEQALGLTEEVGPQADVYSLGVILYEMLTGRPPFHRGTVYQVLKQVIGKAPARPGRLRHGLPAPLEALCLKCLEKEPSRRPAGALALAEELCRFREGEPLSIAEARRDGLAYRMLGWWRGLTLTGWPARGSRA